MIVHILQQTLSNYLLVQNIVLKNKKIKIGFNSINLIKIIITM